jgi:GNAT superfamily N-acetyltransferase
MNLRIALPADADALAAMRWTWRVGEEAAETCGESREEFMERFGDFAADALTDRWTVWIAEEDGQILSTIWVCRVPKVPSPGRQPRDFGYMTNVYTTPEARDRSVGGALLAAVTAWAREADLEMIIVWPSERSVAWYRRGGFVPSREMVELEVSGYEG